MSLTTRPHPDPAPTAVQPRLRAGVGAYTVRELAQRFVVLIDPETVNAVKGKIGESA